VKISEESRASYRVGLFVVDAFWEHQWAWLTGGEDHASWLEEDLKALGENVSVMGRSDLAELADDVLKHWSRVLATPEHLGWAIAGSVMFHQAALRREDRLTVGELIEQVLHRAWPRATGADLAPEQKSTILDSVQGALTEEGRMPRWRLLRSAHRAGLQAFTGLGSDEHQEIPIEGPRVLRSALFNTGRLLGIGEGQITSLDEAIPSCLYSTQSALLEYVVQRSPVFGELNDLAATAIEAGLSLPDPQPVWFCLGLHLGLAGMPGLFVEPPALRRAEISPGATPADLATDEMRRLGPTVAALAGGERQDSCLWSASVQRALRREFVLAGAPDEPQVVAAAQPTQADVKPPETVRPRPQDTFRKTDQVWEITYKGKTVHVADCKGLFYIARLLERPNQRISCLALVCSLQVLCCAA